MSNGLPFKEYSKAVKLYFDMVIHWLQMNSIKK